MPGFFQLHFYRALYKIYFNLISTDEQTEREMDMQTNIDLRYYIDGIDQVDTVQHFF